MLVLCNAKAWQGSAPKAEEQQGLIALSQGMVPSHMPSAVGVPHHGRPARRSGCLSLNLSFPFPSCFFLFFLSGGVMGLVK